MNSLNAKPTGDWVLILMKVVWMPLLVTAAAPKGFAQTAPGAPTADLQARAYLSQAVLALNGKTTVSDATLQASIGSSEGDEQENGVATFETKPGQKSHIRLNLASGTREEIRNGLLGVWSATDGQKHLIAAHNCWSDTAWFFPGLLLATALNDPQISVVYVGQEDREGEAVQHLQIFRLVPAQTADTASLIQRLSSVDIYLDAASHLPTALAFNVHPDTNAGLDIPVEIRFGSYQATNGVEAPFHIQKLLQGTLLLDINVSGVAINSGISDGDFAF